MAPESQPGNAVTVEAEPTLAFEKIYPKERQECLEADPFQGYEKFKGISGPRLEKRLFSLGESLVGPSTSHVKLLWNQKRGEVWVGKGIFAGGIYQGFRQREAGFERYEAEYHTPSYTEPYKHVTKDASRQDYECSLVTSFDELSEPIPTDNPDYDSVSGEAVVSMIKSWVRHSENPNGFGGHLENGDWIYARAGDFGVVIPEQGEQVWAALRTSGSDEAQAARIGHNARLYRQNFGLLRRKNRNKDGLATADGSVILVPIGMSVG